MLKNKKIMISAIKSIRLRILIVLPLTTTISFHHILFYTNNNNGYFFNNQVMTNENCSGVAKKIDISSGAAGEINNNNLPFIIFYLYFIYILFI